MTTPPDPHDRRPEEQADEPQKETHIDKLERRRRELEGFIHSIMAFTHPELGPAHDHPEFALHQIHAQCRSSVGDYDDAIEAMKDMEVSDRSKPTRADLEGALREIADGVQDAVDGKDSMTYTQVIRLANTALGGDTEADPERPCLTQARDRIADLEAEVGRLRSSLEGVRRLLYGSRSPYEKGGDRERPHHYEAAVAPYIVQSDDGEHPSACSFRVEQVEAVAEIVETGLSPKYSTLQNPTPPENDSLREVAADALSLLSRHMISLGKDPSRLDIIPRLRDALDRAEGPDEDAA